MVESREFRSECLPLERVLPEENKESHIDLIFKHIYFLEVATPKIIQYCSQNWIKLGHGLSDDLLLFRSSS